MNPLDWSDRKMIVIRAILTAIVAAIAGPTFGAVLGEWRVNLLRGSTTQETLRGSTQQAAWEACLARIPRAATSSVTYTCQTPRYVATVTPDPTPTPTPVPTPTPTPVPTPTPTPGVTKWATPNGSATSSCTQAQPCTLARAMAFATAGDTVDVAAGIHTTTCTSTRYMAAFRPTNSGTASAPIRFVGHGSDLRCTGSGPVLGTLNASYIELDGFLVDENRTPSVPDTGPVTIWGSRHITLRNSTVIGASISRMDNHTGVRIEGAQDIQILNNRILGVREIGGAGQNTACIMGYDSIRVTIDGNTIGQTDPQRPQDACDVGIFPKGDHNTIGLGGWIIRKNRVTGARWAALHVGGLKSGSTYGRNFIEENLLTGQWGIVLRSYDLISPRAMTINNNTIVASDAGIIATGPPPGIPPNPATAPYTDTQIRDNVIQASVVAINYHWSSPKSGFSSDYNLLWAPTVGASVTWYGDGAPRYTLSSWRSTMGLDTRSQNSDPRLTDYKLPAGSPGLTGSSTGGVIGIRP
jgi:hypothetical protein